MTAPRYLLDWFGGSSAVLDLQTDVEDEASRYLLRYTSPFRPTMRAPRQELSFGEYDLDQINQDLDEFSARVADVSRGEPTDGSVSAVDSELAELGRQIFEMVLPSHVKADLRRRGLFLELGTDEALLHYPWELMNDGTSFVCLSHHIGRYVNIRRPEANARLLPEPGTDLGQLRMLIIAVPQPKPLRGMRFQELPAVDAEVTAILETLGKIGVEPDYISPQKASRTNVLKALRSPYHIVHFSGHAVFNPAAPNRSALIVDDADLTVGALTAQLTNQRSILFVVNACETTRPGRRDAAASRGEEPSSWRDQYNIYGLARAFLESGAYLLGSRWKLQDQSAQRFASVFYDSLLQGGTPIGRAITIAREAVKDTAAPDDFSWASYVYYGDPRVCFRRSTEVAEEPVPAGAGADAIEPEPQPSLSAQLHELARTYEAVRESKPAGPERTSELSELVAQAAAVATDVTVSSVVPELVERSEGDRIISLGVLEAKPDPTYFDFVHDVIEQPQSPFEQYHGLKAAARMLPNLSFEQQAELGTVVKSIAEDPGYLGTNQYLVASQILGRMGIESDFVNPDFE